MSCVGRTITHVWNLCQKPREHFKGISNVYQKDPRDYVSECVIFSFLFRNSIKMCGKNVHLKAKQEQQED